MVKGKTEQHFIGGKGCTITELLGFRRVRQAVASRSTEGSKRELLRAMLRGGKVLPSMLAGQESALGTYGSQRRRAGEPLRNRRGDVIQGPRLTHEESYDGPFDPTAPLPDRRYGGQRKGPLRNNKGWVVWGAKNG